MVYRKHPEMLEAFQYDGDLQNSKGEYYIPEWAQQAVRDGVLRYEESGDAQPELMICDDDGSRWTVSVGDYVTFDSKGRLGRCASTYFEREYEPFNFKTIVDFGPMHTSPGYYIKYSDGSTMSLTAEDVVKLLNIKTYDDAVGDAYVIRNKLIDIQNYLLRCVHEVAGIKESYKDTIDLQASLSKEQHSQNEEDE